MKQQTSHELRKFLAPEFVFGIGAAALVGQYAANLSMKKPLIVTDPHLMEIDWPIDIIDNLTRQQFDYALFSRVTANPRDIEVMQGADFFFDQGCDSIIAIGGGSCIDCAKGIGIVCTNKRNILEFEGADNVDLPGPPLVCVPTTAGSAADVSQFCIITDTARNVKITIVSKTMVPDVSLIDPLLTTTMSPSLTAHTGLDALTHACEAYVSNASSAFTDLNALEAVRLIKSHLLRAIHAPKDMEARIGMMQASTFAGLAFSNAILGSVHAMAHSLGGLLDLPHGLCNALLLDHVIEYNYGAAPLKYNNLGIILGARIDADMSFEDGKEAVLQAFRALKKAAGVPCDLRELGVKKSDLLLLARNALNDPCTLTNPRKPTLEDLLHLFEQVCT